LYAKLDMFFGSKTVVSFNITELLNDIYIEKQIKITLKGLQKCARISLSKR